MATENQIFAARANGAKSQGPVSPEGKLRSSQNSLVHGLCAAALLIDGESSAAFDALKADIFEDFHPVNTCEAKLAEIAVVALWRLARMWEVERATMNKEICRQPGGLPAERAAGAFADLAAGSRVLDLFHRYDARFERQYHRALNQLQRQRDARARMLAQPENAILPNEPGEDLTSFPSTIYTDPISTPEN